MDSKLVALKVMLEADGFNCELTGDDNRAYLGCCFKKCWFFITDRAGNDRLEVNAGLIKSELDPTRYFKLDVPSVNISKSKEPHVIYKELHKRFIAEFLHQSEICLKKLKEVESALNQDSEIKKELGTFVGQQLDLQRSINTFTIDDHLVSIQVGGSIAIRVSNLNLEQAKRILEVIK